MDISFQKIGFTILIIWLGLVIFVTVNSQPIVDNIISLTQLVFYVASLFIIKKIYRESNVVTRQAFTLLFVAISIAFATDFINYCMLFILNHVNFFIHEYTKNTLSRLDKILYVADYIELFLWYIIVFVFLLNFLRTFLINQSRYQIQFGIFATCLLLSLITLLYLSQPQKLRDANFFTLIAFFSSITEISTFIIAIYGLIHSKSWSLYLLLTSIIVMVVTQISALFYYSYHIKSFLKLAYIRGPLWVMMIFLTFYYMYKKKDYDLQKWFVAPNTLEAQLSFSTLVITCFSFIIFFILAYIFNLLNAQKLLSFFFFLIIYGLVAVLAAKRIALFFANPFQKLQINMGELMAAQVIPDQLPHFEIAEFDFLQKFIYERFVEHETQSATIKTMGQMAIQVAHDIRSPAAAIMMLAKDSENLPEDQRVSLRNAATRVQDIANNLLTDYQKNHLYTKNTTLMLVPTIMSVISEKRAQYHDRNLKISLLVDYSSYFIHVTTQAIEFKRALSNLINNAVEAISSESAGEINIKVNLEKDIAHVVIQDNGQGISCELLELINNDQQIKSTKKGLGLGLQHAKKFMKDMKGNISFKSQPNKGTSITLIFKLANTPCWLINEIRVSAHQNIIILDDDQAIHGAWDHRFAIWKNQHPSITLKHFHSGKDCLNYILSLNKSEQENILFLSDQELINQDITGLDVIEQSGIKQAILVTSYYDNEDIIRRAILANTKILPKMLAAEVALSPSSIKKKTIKKIDGVLLDDQPELSEIIQFLAENRKAVLETYLTPYQLWDNLLYYPADTIFCLDYDLGLPVNGIDIAKRLNKMGYQKLYLATGYHIQQEAIPSYLKKLTDKMALLDYIKRK